MLTRTLALKTMLVALAGAAALSIVSIFLQNDLGWRLAGVAAIVGVATALAIPATPGEAGGRLKVFARVYLGMLAFGAATAVLAAWTDGTTPFPELFVLWLLLWVPSLLAAAPALHSRDGAERALVLAEAVSIGGAGIACGLGLARLVLDLGFGIGSTGLWSGIGESFLILGPSVTAAAAAIGLRRSSTSRLTPLPAASAIDRVAGVLGIVASGAVCVASLASVILHETAMTAQDAPIPGVVRALEPLAVTAAAPAVAAAAWCFLGLTVVPGFLRYLRHLSVFAILLTGLLVSAVQWMIFVENSPYGWSDHAFLAQMTFAFSVLAGSSLLAALVLMRVHRSRPHVGGRIARVDWRCPRCGRREVIALGVHSCPECGLSAEVRVRDDRCAACGYDLHGIPVDAVHCPECGNARQRPDAPALL